MELPKILNLLENAPCQQSTFMKKNWVEMNDDSCGMYDTNSQFKGTLSGLRKFLATGSPLKMLKNIFYFTSKALFILKIFKFLS